VRRGRTNIEVTERPPVDVLTLADDRENRIFAPLRLVLQCRNTNIEKRENQIGSTESLFTSEKRFKLEFAIMTGDRSRRDNRDEKYCLLDCRFDFRFPELARGDRLLILP